MLHPKQLLILLAFIFSSCHHQARYPYAIKDFPEKLQPYLTSLIEKGIVMGGNSGIRDMTDAELQRLGRSEHPILRAVAFREMQDRKSLNYFDIMMAHLDDTAVVFTDNGEFGVWDKTVSDDILHFTVWETQEAKNKTVEQVLSKHNYLRSAYTILNTLEPQEKYYPFIKDMATRPRRLDPYEDYELAFGDIEYALYGLARFKKKEDIGIIKQQLMKHSWELSSTSFALMTEYPDTAYMDVLQQYHRRQFYKFSGNRPDGPTGFPADRASPESFINAVVAQQNDRSARLLDTMLTFLPKHPPMPEKEYLVDEIVKAIWDHPCAAYTKLRQKIKSRAVHLLKQAATGSVLMDSFTVQADTMKPPIRWWSD